MKLLRSARVLALLMLATSPALAQKQITPTSPPPQIQGSEVTADGRRTLNMKDADIEALIATVSEITGKNFIVSPLVQGKVTVVSARPMKPDEIYDVFLSVLRVHGLAAVQTGSMVKIVPETMAQQDGAATVGGSRRKFAAWTRNPISRC